MMSEVKNEGLEVAAWMDEDGCLHTTPESANFRRRPVTELCRHSEALALVDGLRGRVAELEGDLKCAHSMLGEVSKKGMELRAELAAIKAQEPVAWMLKNEKGRIEEILPYMPCASDMQLYWPEPTPLYTAPVAKPQSDDWVPSGGDYDRAIHHNPDAKAWADFFVATFPRLADKHDLMLGWFANSMMAMHDYLLTKPVAKQEVMPDREKELFNAAYQVVVDNGWTNVKHMARQVWDHARLNAAPEQS